MLPPTDLESDKNLYDHVDEAIICSGDSAQRENKVVPKIRQLIVAVVVTGGIAAGERDDVKSF
jgi:hypothetical protein